MIPRIHKRGANTYGLLAYLYGPGQAEEHTDPHVVASFDGMAPDPGRDAAATLKQLQKLLDQPVVAIEEERRPAKHVWHVSVRNAPEDPVLADEGWAEIARRMVAATGIDRDDGAGCRWVAVRHADDHIHIVATLVREDGYKPDLDNDAARAQAEARLLEAHYGLRQLNPGDKTAAKRPSSAERHKAERQGRVRTPREELREAVRQAKAGADSDQVFLDQLGRAGLLIRTRTMPSGDLSGYSVAVPGDVNSHGEPVFYSGSTLAPDLSLPRIRQQYRGPSAPGDNDSQAPSSSGRSGRRPARVRRQTTEAAWEAILVIEEGEDGAAAAEIAATGEVLDALTKTSAAHTRGELRNAAAALERASRSHVRASRHHGQALHNAARDLVHSGRVLGHGEEGAGTAMAIDMLFFLVTAAAHWHQRHHHAQQAAAARQAAGHLRAAYLNAAGPPLDRLHQRGRTLPVPTLDRQVAMIQRALPDLAGQILAETGWYALAATLTDTEQAGHDAVQLLSEAAARRELGTAESISDVLNWRLRRSANLPASPTPPSRPPHPHPPSPTSPTTATRHDPGHGL